MHPESSEAKGWRHLEYWVGESWLEVVAGSTSFVLLCWRLKDMYNSILLKAKEGKANSDMTLMLLVMRLDAQGVSMMEEEADAAGGDRDC